MLTGTKVFSTPAKGHVAQSVCGHAGRAWAAYTATCAVLRGEGQAVEHGGG